MTDLMNVVYDPKEIFPPTVGNIWVQINNQEEWQIEVNKCRKELTK